MRSLLSSNAKGSIGQATIKGLVSDHFEKYSLSIEPRKAIEVSGIMENIKTKELFEKLSNDYFGNNGTKIRRVSDSVLKKLQYVPDYPDEFYSLAGEVFQSIYDQWKPEYKFDTFLYGCLLKRFKSQLTHDNAEKRGGVNKVEVSLSQEIAEDLTLEDTIGEEQKMDFLSSEMVEYLNSLNSIQKKIYLMITDGYEPREIQKKLGITSKVYNRELRDSRSYDKVKILRQLESKTREEGEGEKSMPNDVNRTNECTHDTTTVQSIRRSIKNGTLRDDNPLQRATDNWNNEMKSNLMVTAMNGFGIPGLTICERRIGNSYVKEIIDGLQRCSSFIGFLENTFKISKKVERPMVTYQVFKGFGEDGLPIHEMMTFDVRGKKFSDLPEELQSKIEDYNIHVDTYLKCSNEDVEYHIRRLNSSRSMNHSQRGLTFIGSNFAMSIKRITGKDFFRDTYKITDKRNGNIQRMVFESVMLINFEDDWISAPEKIGAFLSENANTSQFENFGTLVDRVDDVLDDETRKLFNMRDSFVWFKVFSDFLRLGVDDEKFNDFLKAFDGGLKEKVVDGVNYADLCVKSTKDLLNIRRKVEYLESLLWEFLGFKKEKEFDLSYGSEFESFVSEVRNITDGIVNVDAKTAIKTFFALRGEEDLSDSHIQELINETENADFSEELNDAISYVHDFIDDWAINVALDSSILKKEMFASLVRLYKYSCESDVEGNRAQEWFLNLEYQERTNPILVGNYQIDWKVLIKKFQDFSTYERYGVA